VVPVLALLLLWLMDWDSTKHFRTVRHLLAIIRDDVVDGGDYTISEKAVLMLGLASRELVRESFANAALFNLKVILSYWTVIPAMGEIASLLIDPLSSNAARQPAGWDLFQGIVIALIFKMFKHLDDVTPEHALQAWLLQLTGIIETSHSTSTTDTPSPKLKAESWERHV